ncbi:hypothetical protein [Carboxylicivirga linearis]|uniref:Outer membrane protein beta-barrel domain-containing protein n=1 Tax=Carboxylicivirga linearis TaxID=1628157 RepID=A0ABS5JPP2_9BACT|nr:hypothetical protein [Carboxylicivirga linearis]MBS2096859.1 hypothetical protein [Carboxylicivirga linearis]
MKKNLLLIVLLCSTLSVFAQKHKSTVYLKNGTVIKCEILEIIPDEGLKIQTGSHELMLSNQEIEKIEVNGKAERINNSQPITNKGFFNKTTVGILAGSSSNNEQAPFVLTSSMGYYILPKISAGLGTGIELYQEAILPVYAELQYFFNNNPKAPYLFTHGGWAFSIDDRKNTSSYEYNSMGGIRYGGGAGLRIWTHSGFGLVAEVGYQYQEIKTEKTEVYMNYKSTLYDQYNRLAIKLGFYFN